MKTLLLDQTAWDLVIDSNANIALADDPYALAQDCQSAIRTFLGECEYNTTEGVPYFDEILGHTPPLGVLTNALETVCLTVPEVTSAQCFVTSFQNRSIQGYILVNNTIQVQF